MTDSSPLSTITQWPVNNAAGAEFFQGTITCVGDTSHNFWLASVSKLITAYTVLIAVEEGAFKLDEPLTDILKQAEEEQLSSPQSPASIRLLKDTPHTTARQLLAHTSGIAFRQRRSIEKEPEKRRIYSSAAYEVLADMITVSTGIEFVDYVHAALCEPLDIDITIESSAGHGFSASVDALIPLVQEFLNPQLISSHTLEEALSNQYADLAGIVPGYGRHNPCPWGLGFELHGHKSPHWMGDKLPSDLAGHFGQGGTFLWFHPASQRAVIVLTDEMFGEWSKDLWPTFNNEMWESMNQREK